MSSQGLISNRQGRNPRRVSGIPHPFFDDGGKSNIYGFNDKKGELDMHSKKQILASVSKYNNYYKSSESDVKVSGAYAANLKSLDKRIYAGAYIKPGGGRGPLNESFGRIDGVGKGYIPSFHINQENEQEIYNSFSSDSVKGNVETTDFSRYYFSEPNVMNLQRQIKAEVHKLSRGKFVIDNQSENALKTVMRSYFLQYKMSNNKDVLSQIKEVNKKVINWCADNIFSHLLQYQQYKKDITTMPQQMSRSLNVSIKGNNAGFDLSSRNHMHKYQKSYI